MIRKFLYAGLAVSAVLALSFPVTAQAQTTTTTTSTMGSPVKVNVTPAADVNAERVRSGTALLFWVDNPSSQTLTFSIPEKGVQYPVPANSSRTFYVNTGAMDDRSFDYIVTGPGNEKLAGGRIINEDFIDTTQTLASLNSIINYSTAYSAPIMPEPQYRERPVAAPAPVRGFW